LHGPVRTVPARGFLGGPWLRLLSESMKEETQFCPHEARRHGGGARARAAGQSACRRRQYALRGTGRAGPRTVPPAGEDGVAAAEARTALMLRVNCNCQERRALEAEARHMWRGCSVVRPLVVVGSTSPRGIGIPFATEARRRCGRGRGHSVGIYK
jgi:hypothetical protein